jgi:hypothetical protein
MFSLSVTGKEPHDASDPHAVCTKCPVGCRSNCCNLILPPEMQSPFRIKIYSQGTDPRENTFSERSPTKHALLRRV